MRGDKSNNPDMKTNVQCFPLYSILLAIGNPVIDLFSLDIEGKHSFKIKFLVVISQYLFHLQTKINLDNNVLLNMNPLKTLQNWLFRSGESSA